MKQFRVSCKRWTTSTVTCLGWKPVIVNLSFAIQCLLKAGYVGSVALSEGPAVQGLVITLDMRLIGRTTGSTEAMYCAQTPQPQSK